MIVGWALDIIIKKLEQTQGKINIKKLLYSHQIEILQKYLNRQSIPLSKYYYNKDSKTELLVLDPKKLYDHLISVIYLNKFQINTLPLPLEFYKKVVISNKHYEDDICYGLDIDKLYDLLSYDDITYTAYSIEDKSKINVGNIGTVLINSDFNVNFNR